MTDVICQTSLQFAVVTFCVRYAHLGLGVILYFINLY